MPERRKIRAGWPEGDARGHVRPSRSPARGRTHATCESCRALPPAPAVQPHVATRELARCTSSRTGGSHFEAAHAGGCG
ncbi:hypothetical protein LHGZ1_2682 [Laribacter hongkongensis]|uniref:Uncharacterized protein n=1 Tax=Laribacter hongkongensis TaxID=168471 RepID=A0A248LMX2_9NEIS|nr:hypothetical protein LHGZ1_2682 [Laribacter hongkongensis]